MQIKTEFVPIKLMLQRLSSSKQDSDSAYFWDLLFLGEMITKTVVAGLVAGISNDTDRNRYRQLHRLVRADGIGEWSTVLEETIGGVSSQFLQNDVRLKEKKELDQKCEEGSWQYESVRQLIEAIKNVGLPAPFRDLPKKIQGKTWFNHFATLRNGTRGHGATLPVSCSEATNPLYESIKLLVENFALFQREWVFLYQNLSGKYRVTTLNGSGAGFDVLKNDRSFVSKYWNGVYVLFDERTRVELIRSTPEAADFSFPNGNFREKSFEYLSYVSDTRSEGDSSRYMTPAEDLPPSETEGLGKLEVIGNCFCNLPPIYKTYINRSDLEGELFRVLNETDRYPIITLKGGGGIGKTSLALSVLHELTKNERFQIILWFSSRDIDLQAEGAKPVKNKILDEKDIANEFLDLLEIKGVVPGPQRIDILAKKMSKSEDGPILFVFDNFETVRNSSELFSWLDTFIRNPNKILITSRTSGSFKADYPIEVTGMKEVECRELISRTAIDFEISYLVDELTTEKIIQESNGHPYVVKMLLAAFSKDQKVTDITRVVAAKEDILVALFRRTYDWLSPSAKRVFLTLCSWRSVIPQIALEATLLRAENERIDVIDAIEELRKSSFIEVITNQNGEAFLSVPLAASLFGKSELEVSADKVAILLDRDLLQEFGAAQQTDINNGIKPRILRKFREIANQVSKGETELETHRPTLEYIASKFPEGWVYLAKMYEENGELRRAQDAWREFIKTNPTAIDKREAWAAIADLYRRSSDWFSQVNALVELISLPNTTLLEISEVANEINRYFQQNKLDIDSDIKEKILLKVAELMENQMQYASATDFSRLAWLYLHLRDESSAIRMTLKGLNKDRQNSYCRNLALRLNLSIA